MTPFLQGFAEELVKTAGALKTVGGLALKHPILALTAAGTIASTAGSAASAYKEGLKGGEKGKYLGAGIEPYTNRAAASPAAYTNYHQLFERKPSNREVHELSRFYDAKKFRR